MCHFQLIQYSIVQNWTSFEHLPSLTPLQTPNIQHFFYQL